MLCTVVLRVNCNILVRKAFKIWFSAHVHVSVSSEASDRKVLQHLGHFIFNQTSEIYHTAFIRHTCYVFAAETYKSILEGLEICSDYTSSLFYFSRTWFCFLLKFLQPSMKAKSKTFFTCFENSSNCCCKIQQVRWYFIDLKICCTSMQ